MTCTWPAQSCVRTNIYLENISWVYLITISCLEGQRSTNYLLGHWVKSPAPANTLLTMVGGSLRKIFFWDFVRNQYDPYWLLTEEIFCETLAHYLSSGSFIPQVGQWHEYFKRGFVYHSVHNIRKKMALLRGSCFFWSKSLGWPVAVIFINIVSKGTGV